MGCRTGPAVTVRCDTTETGPRTSATPEEPADFASRFGQLLRPWFGPPYRSVLLKPLARMGDRDGARQTTVLVQQPVDRPAARRARRSRDIVAPRSVTAHRTFRHEALLWRGIDDFLATTVPFVRDGLDGGEAVMVAATGEHNEWLHGALGVDADRVHFVDMLDLGRNPVRIITALRGFIDEGIGGGGAVRGIGEPIWRGRRAEEVLESQLSEALINVAVEPDSPVWLMCPYEADSLDPTLIEEVYRSHPAVIDGTTYRGSPSYGGRAHLDEVFTAELPPLSGLQGEMVFERNELQQVSKLVAATAFAAGVAPDRAAELAVVVKELAASSLQRGARVGRTSGR
jgi:hypothetical protein